MKVGTGSGESTPLLSLARVAVESALSAPLQYNSKMSAAHAALGEGTVDIMIVVASQSHLLEVVLAFHAVGGLAHFLHGRQEQPNQDGNDGDHHQQLDQGEAFARPPANLRVELRHAVDPPWAIHGYIRKHKTSGSHGRLKGTAPVENSRMAHFYTPQTLEHG